MRLEQGDFVKFRTGMWDMVWEVFDNNTMVRTFCGYVYPVSEVVSVEPFCE